MVHFRSAWGHSLFGSLSPRELPHLVVHFRSAWVVFPTVFEHRYIGNCKYRSLLHWPGVNTQQCIPAQIGVLNKLKAACNRDSNPAYFKAVSGGRFDLLLCARTPQMTRSARTADNNLADIIRQRTRSISHVAGQPNLIQNEIK